MVILAGCEIGLLHPDLVLDVGTARTCDVAGVRARDHRGVSVARRESTVPTMSAAV